MLSLCALYSSAAAVTGNSRIACIISGKDEALARK